MRAGGESRGVVRTGLPSALILVLAVGLLALLAWHIGAFRDDRRTARRLKIALGVLRAGRRPRRRTPLATPQQAPADGCTIELAGQAVDPGTVRLMHRLGGYGDGRRFPGIRKALRELGRDFRGTARVVVAALVLPWRELLSLRAAMASPAPVLVWPEVRAPLGRLCAEVCPTTGPPVLLLAARGAVVTDP